VAALLPVQTPRIDGRDTKTIRQVVSVYCLQVHGSALFTRGGEQALVVTTLGTKRLKVL